MQKNQKTFKKIIDKIKNNLYNSICNMKEEMLNKMERYANINIDEIDFEGNQERIRKQQKKQHRNEIIKNTLCLLGLIVVVIVSGLVEIFM